MHLPSIESISKSYEHVYVSPHLDDVVLSCGGRIIKQIHNSETVLIVTTFTREVDRSEKPKARALAHLVNIQDRRLEDEKAMARLGADFLWLDYPDGIFRYRIPLLRFGLRFRIAAWEKSLFEGLLADIRRICEAAQNESLYLPLGVGQHKDHHILFQIGRHLLQSADQDYIIRFYEDFPYILFPIVFKYRLKLLGVSPDFLSGANSAVRKGPIVKEVLNFYKGVLRIPSLNLNNPFKKPIVYLFLMLFGIFSACLANMRMGASGRLQLSPEIFDVSSVIKEKLEAAFEYRSQLSKILQNRELMRDAFRKYSSGIGGEKGQYLERYWKTEQVYRRSKTIS